MIFVAGRGKEKAGEFEIRRLQIPLAHCLRR